MLALAWTFTRRMLQVSAIVAICLIVFGSLSLYAMPTESLDAIILMVPGLGGVLVFVTAWLVVENNGSWVQLMPFSKLKIVSFTYLMRLSTCVLAVLTSFVILFSLIRANSFIHPSYRSGPKTQVSAMTPAAASADSISHDGEMLFGRQVLPYLLAVVVMFHFLFMSPSNKKKKPFQFHRPRFFAEWARYLVPFVLFCFIAFQPAGQTPRLNFICYVALMFSIYWAFALPLWPMPLPSRRKLLWLNAAIVGLICVIGITNI